MSDKTKTKKVLLNLDGDLYAQLDEDADRQGLSVTEWLRGAIKQRLSGPPAPVTAPDLFADRQAVDEPPFDPTQAVQKPDKRNAEHWLRRIKELSKMDGNRAMAELVHETGGIRPPAHLFSSASTLAFWLAEHVE